MINSMYTNCTLNSEKIPFLNQIPFFSQQKIQLEVAHNMSKLDYINIHSFDMFVGQLGGCASLHALGRIFLLCDI